MLPCSCLGNDPRLTHLLCKQHLSQDIVVDVLVATGNSVWYTNMASSATDDSIADDPTVTGKSNVWRFTIEAATATLT